MTMIDSLTTRIETLQDQLARSNERCKSAEDMVCVHLNARMKAENLYEYQRFELLKLSAELETVKKSLQATELAAEDARRKNVILLDENKKLARGD